MPLVQASDRADKKGLILKLPYSRDNKRLFENKHGSKIFENKACPKHWNLISLIYRKYFIVSPASIVSPFESKPVF